MKLLDIMKKYDRCLVRESAKLAKIYNMILKESECSEEVNEETCPDCGNDPCTCDDEVKNENDADMVPESEFFEACKGDECKDVDECGLIPEEDFIQEESEEVEENDMLRNRPHNGHINDPRGVIAEGEDEDGEDKSEKKACKGKECDENEDKGKMMSAKEFFAEAAKEAGKEDCVNEEEEMMSAAEFFAEADKNAKPVEETDSKDEVNEDEGIVLGPNWQKIDAHELLPEAEEKKLEESLKSYRRKNHRLFNG